MTQKKEHPEPSETSLQDSVNLVRPRSSSVRCGCGVSDTCCPLGCRPHVPPVHRPSNWTVRALPTLRSEDGLAGASTKRLPWGECMYQNGKAPCGPLHNGMCNHWVSAKLPVHLGREPWSRAFSSEWLSASPAGRVCPLLFSGLRSLIRPTVAAPEGCCVRHGRGAVNVSLPLQSPAETRGH